VVEDAYKLGLYFPKSRKSAKEESEEEFNKFLEELYHLMEDSLMSVDIWIL